MLFMSLISDNIHVHVYQKVQKESVTLFSFFKIWQKWYKKTLKNKSCFQWNRGENIYLRTFWHVKQIVPVPLPCLQPIDDMGRDRNTCSRAKVAFGICWQSAICPYSYCQYDSMVYNQALLTEAFQVLYFNSHPSPIYIHFLQVDFLEEVKFARF